MSYPSFTNVLKNKVVKLLAVIHRDDEKPHSMTIIPDYDVAFLLSLARAYDRPDKTPREVISSFYDYYEKYLIAVGGRGREDIKELITQREYFKDKELMEYLVKLYRSEKEGVRIA